MKLETFFGHDTHTAPTPVYIRLELEGSPRAVEETLEVVRGALKTHLELVELSR